MYYSKSENHDFDYTDEVTPNSSLVDAAYYNANDKTLALDLNDMVYVYVEVEEADFKRFATTDSAGGYYNTEFKNKYGPATFLGDISDLYFRYVAKEKAPSVGTPKGLVDNTQPTKEFSLNVNNAKAPFDTVETVDATKEFSLKTPEPVNTKVDGDAFNVEVHYVLNGYTNGYVFNTTADDVSDALDALSNNLKALGLSGRATKAVINFE
jgi:KTSC domain